MKNSDQNFFKEYAEYLSGMLLSLDFSILKNVANLIIQQAEKGKTIYLMGNGGSATTTSHFVTDLMHCWGLGHKPIIKALSISENISLITAIANDVGYEKIFSSQIEKLGDKGDILIGISASGNSSNILGAFNSAKKLNIHTVAIVGFDGGKAAQLADYTIHVKSKKNEYGPVEDAHLFIDHMLTSFIAHTLSSKNAKK